MRPLLQWRRFLTGAPAWYTEDKMTATSLNPGRAQLHDAGHDVSNHFGCCSTSFEFTCNKAGDTCSSLKSIVNVSGEELRTSSAGGSQFVSANGTVNFGGGFEIVEWERRDESSGNNVSTTSCLRHMGEIAARYF